MPAPVIKTSFGAGEIAPNLWGRVDLAKYASGAAVMRNFFVDYRGGASTRPGTECVGLVPDLGTKPRIIPFQFNTSQSYQLVLYGSKMRFIQDGAFIVETGLAVTAGFNTVPFQLKVPGNTYSVGDWVVVDGVGGLDRPNGLSGCNGRTFIVAAAGTIITLADPQGYPMTSDTWTPYSVFGTVSRIYTIDTPWAGADLYALNYTQSADVLTVVHPSYPPYDINRLGQANWTITAEAFGSSLAPPTGGTATAINNTPTDFQYLYTYVVTARNSLTGEESNASAIIQVENKALQQTEDLGISNEISWSAVTGADSYRVYKCQVIPGSSTLQTTPLTVGLIGNVTGLTYQDTNYLPDYTQSPPINRNPLDDNNPSVVAYFDQRRVYAASLIDPDTFWMTKPGLYSNFDVSEPSQADDALTGTIVAQQVNAITSLTAMTSGLIALTSNGAYLISGGQPGAALTPSTIQAQAQAFSGASNLQPLRINYDLIYLQARGSAVRDLTYNFYVNIYTGNDISALSSHLFFGNTIVQWAWAEEPFKLVHAVRDDGVLLMLTYLKEQDVYGWSRHDTLGRFCSVSVIPEGNEDRPYYVTQRPLYGGEQYVVERLASRLFGANPAQNIPSDPAQTWCVDCGVRAPLSYPEFSISAGAPIPQGKIDFAFVLNGGSGYADGAFCQIFDTDGQGFGATARVNATAGEIITIDILTPGQDYLNPVIEIAGGSGAAVSLRVVNQMQFVSGVDTSSGPILRVAGGVGSIVSVDSSTSFTCNMSTPISGAVANSWPPAIPPTPAGSWSFSRQTKIVGGLDHLNGMTVAIVADGGVQASQVVVDGCLTLEAPANSIVIGLPFTAQLKTLRLEAGEPTMQGRRKNIPSVTLRAMDTRGITVGSDFHHMVEVKERSYENYANPTSFQTEGGFIEPWFENGPTAPNPLSYEDAHINIGAHWNQNGQICIMQSYPLPATILAEVMFVTVGDQ